MTDVFISYANEDRDRAGTMADSLVELGWSVWWDRSIIIGTVFDKAIEFELESAKCVVVLWSKHSVDSEWVKNEAAAAATRGVLIPAMIDKVKIPLEFRRKQTADLTRWHGDLDDENFLALCTGITSSMGRSRLPGLKKTNINPMLRPGRRTWLGMAAVMVICSGLYVVWLGWSHSEQREKPSDEPVHIADLIVGQYIGDVVADTRGISLSNVAVVISKLDQRTVRITSDYRRLGTVDITLTRMNNMIRNDGGDSTLFVELDQQPSGITYNPPGEGGGSIAYEGKKRL